jgi:carbonic anhydrase
MVVGHSNCGGVRGCYDMCSGHASELEEQSSFVGRWMEILRPGFERTADIIDTDERVREMEKQSVAISLENLMTFPFVRDAVANEHLTLHGVWHDIGEGGLEVLDGSTNNFVDV